MSKIFITSDTYFGRPSMIKSGKRNYKTVEEMNNDMISKWNKRVSDTDTVYHLGNFGWDPFSTNVVLQQLNGNIIFLRGNYDKSLDETIVLHSNTKISESRIIELGDYKTILCYYPMLYWNGKEDGIIHVHGCDMNKFPHNTDELRINVSCDYWGLAPIELSVIKDFMKEYKELKKK